MSDENKGFFGLLYGSIRSPGETFQFITEEDLTKGLLIIFFTMVLVGISTVTYLSNIPINVIAPQLADSGVELHSIGSNRGLFAGIGGAIAVLLGYVVTTLLMHGLGTLLGGKGNIKRFFTIHAFATTPFLLNYLFRTIDAYMSDPNLLIGYYLQNREIGNKVLFALLNTNFVNIFGITALISITHAVATNYQISKTKSFIIAFIPYLISFTMSYLTVPA